MNRDRVADFLFEIGTLRNMRRMQSQILPESNDSIASHSFEVAIIGMILARSENADENKVIKMCLFHDIAEARIGDANFIHKFYVQADEDKALRDQIADTPIAEEILAIINEFEARESKEAIIAKDADLLDQILVQSATIKNAEDKKLWNENSAKDLQTEIAKELAKALSDTNPLSWVYKMAE
ncbi:MAG: HD domain-containing protein [Candidatus Pacebacteria bacterium]|nr:HD domain-containing protein [Candidatus Paceibacterota bacterium]